MIDISSVKKRQWYVLGGIMASLMGVGIAFLAISTKDISPSPEKVFKNALATGTDRVNPQEAWVYEFKKEAELTQKRLNSLEDLLAKLMKMNEVPKASSQEAQPITSKPSFSPQAALAGNGGDYAIEAIDHIRNEIKAQTHLMESPDTQTVSPPSSQTLPLPPGNKPRKEDGALAPYPLNADILGASAPFRSKSIRKVTLPLKNIRDVHSLKTVGNTVPAGAFAKAILLGGVDASASIQACSDPRPALLRLMDLGTLPRQFRSDLLGCHVLAAAYGDISSERVFMRLEKLTCTHRKTGEVVEVKAQGYVAGEDGRTGIRGTVVDRAGESLRNVLMGGFLGGIGEFLSQSQNTAMAFSPIAGLGNLAQPSPPGMKDMLKQGAGKGIHNALDKYADFYIKRAEQLQPVIQVAAGRQVDIVFTEGVSIGEAAYRPAFGNPNSPGRYPQTRTTQEEDPNSLKDWTNAPTYKEGSQ